MHVRQLYEADFNFADQADQTFDKFKSLAAAAHGKFKKAYDDAESDVKSDVRDAVTASQKQQRQQATAAARQNKENDLHRLAQSSAGAGDIISMVVGDIYDPDVDTVPQLDGFDAKMFQNFQEALVLAEKRVNNSVPTLRKLVKSNFLDAIDATDAELNRTLAELENTDAIEKEYFRAGASPTLMELIDAIITQDSATSVQRAMLKWLREVDKRHQKHNLAQTKQAPVGPRLVQVLRGIIQIIEHRVLSLKNVANKLEARPQKRVKDEDEEMNESLSALRSLIKRL